MKEGYPLLGISRKICIKEGYPVLGISRKICMKEGYPGPRNIKEDILGI